MKKYTIEIVEALSAHVNVVAESKNEAITKAKDMFLNEEVELGYNAWAETEFNIVDIEEPQELFVCRIRPFESDIFETKVIMATKEDYKQYLYECHVVDGAEVQDYGLAPDNLTMLENKKWRLVNYEKALGLEPEYAEANKELWNM